MKIQEALPLSLGERTSAVPICPQAAMPLFPCAFPETYPLPRRTACIHVHEHEGERPGSSNTWGLRRGRLTGEGPHGALTAPSLMTKLWVKRKVENSVLKTICRRRRSGRQSQRVEARRELVPLRSNGFQIFSTNITVMEGTQAGGGGGGQNIYLRTGMLSEQLCSVQCWLAAELAPWYLGG